MHRCAGGSQGVFGDHLGQCGWSGAPVVRGGPGEHGGGVGTDALHQHSEPWAPPESELPGACPVPAGAATWQGPGSLLSGVPKTRNSPLTWKSLVSGVTIQDQASTLRLQLGLRQLQGKAEG